jgi:hypothetical protein
VIQPAFLAVGARQLARREQTTPGARRSPGEKCGLGPVRRWEHSLESPADAGSPRHLAANGTCAVRGRRPDPILAAGTARGTSPPQQPQRPERVNQHRPRATHRPRWARPYRAGKLRGGAWSVGRCPRLRWPAPFGPDLGNRNFPRRIGPQVRFPWAIRPASLLPLLSPVELNRRQQRQQRRRELKLAFLVEKGAAFVSSVGR